jgi:hypothetical protein
MQKHVPPDIKRAQGMPGEGLTHGPPATKKAGGRHHRFSRIIRHSLRDGFNGVLRTLPGEPGFLAPVTCGLIRRLDTSVGVSGPHDFAVRQSAVRPHEHSRAALSRPSHPDPRFVTTRDPPLLPGQGARMIIMSFRKTEVKYFFRGGWTGIRGGCPSGKSVAPTACDFVGEIAQLSDTLMGSSNFLFVETFNPFWKTYSAIL